MTCHEFRSLLSDGKPSAEAAAHAELRTDCRNLTFAEAELGRTFQLVRDATPDVSASLDDSVMTAYRREMTRHGNTPTRWSLSPPFAWASVAAALIIFVAFLGSYMRMSPRMNLPPIAHKITRPAAPSPKKPEIIAAKRSAKPVQHARKLIAVRHPPAERREESRATLLASEAPETGFQNLMYCDPLSCSGAMQVFRVQLPVSDVEPVSAWRSPTGLVQADVLIGSDGVARAIRFVK